MADAKDVTVIIDGIKVQVPDGTYVWDACRKIGMEIPNFCYIHGLRAFGACRMCVVEVSGRRGFDLVTSCSTPVTDGMEVRTINDRVWQQRNMIMEALDTDHPVDCPICEANGDCRLQDYGYEYGVTGTDLRRPKIVRPAERLSPAVDLDRDRCVVCGRCVRECDESVGALALAFVERGVESLIDAPFGKSLLETPCTSCGMCIELCPVGALSSRINLTMEHHWWQRKTETTCTYCSVGCTIKLGSYRNKVYEVRSDDQLGLNDGRTCVKGRFAMDFINSNDRLSTPLVRRDGRLAPATWDEALELVASRLQQHRGAVGVVASPKLTNEENYLLQKVTRVGLGTNNIDWDGRAVEAPALRVLQEMLGYPAQTNNLIDTRQKAGCVIAIGDSIYETHPVYAYQMQRMIRLMDKKLVVISPTWVKMCEWATLWLAPKAGTEELVVHAMSRVIADAGLHDQAFVDARTEGSTDYLESLEAGRYSLEEVSRRTGVPSKDIVAAAYLYATGGTSSGPEKLPQPTHPSNLPTTRNGSGDAAAPIVEEAVLASKVERPEGGFPPSTIVFPAAGFYVLSTRTIEALTSMALLTGNVGRPGAGVNPLVSDSNCLGANDMGCQPGYFPGYRPVSADNAREMEALWGVNPDEETPEISGDPGLDLYGMVEAAELGDLKAMWVVGSNPVLSVEEANSDRVREALGKLDFLVVQDIFMNETAELADVVLPASSYAEKEGTYTNTERRIQRVRQAIEPLGATKPDLAIIALVGSRLGVSLPATQPKEVLEEIARVVPLYGGVSFARLDMTEFIDDAIPMPAAVSYKQLKVKSLMWPCPERLDPGTPVLYTDTFATASGKAKVPAASELATQGSEAAGSTGEVLMATLGLPLFPFRTGTLSRHSYGLSRVEPDPRLHIHSRDAARLGIDDQAPVQVTIEGVQSTDPIYAVSLVYDRVPEGRAFLAVTLEQAGTNTGVREARHMLQSGAARAVPIRVQPAPHIRRTPQEQLQPVATANVLDTSSQPL
jgi:predicted molibdopterin-dependent oxidoreductase YjgC